QHLAINVDVVFDHSLAAEILFNVPSKGACLRIRNRTQSFNRAVHAADDETGFAVLDYLRNQAARLSDYPRAPSHCFDHAQPKRLVEAYQMQHRISISENLISQLGADRTDVFHTVTIDAGLNLSLKVFAVLDDSRDDQPAS